VAEFQAQTEQQVVHHHSPTVVLLQLPVAEVADKVYQNQEVQVVQVVLVQAHQLVVETVVLVDKTQEITEVQAAVVPVDIQVTVDKVQLLVALVLLLERLAPEAEVAAAEKAANLKSVAEAVEA
jgi:hypothetical protein